MGVDKEYIFLTTLSCYFVFNLTRTSYSLMNRINILENKLESIKERLSDLELFKLRVYNQEIVPGRRAWEDIDIDIDLEDEEID
tara:strand:+ start:939 stop:1190 length:252 start_codon:yes stop_codon:yes gene_type:complete